LTPKELSEALDLPLQNTHALARAGQMPVIGLGRTMRLDPRMLAE